MAATNIIQLIQQISKRERQASKPADVMIGTVLAVKPLKIGMTSTHKITKEFLIWPESFEKSTIKKGDQLILIRQQGGQKFLVFDKEVG